MEDENFEIPCRGYEDKICEGCELSEAWVRDQEFKKEREENMKELWTI